MSNTMTRRQAVTGLVAFGASALSLPRTARADLKALEDAARKEGTLTWYMAQVDTEKATALARAFTSEYPDIRVALIRTTGQVAYQRLLLDIKNHTPQCDVFSTSDISHMPALKERHELTPFTPQNAAGLLPEFRRLSDEGNYYVTNAGRYFLIYTPLTR